METVNAWSKEGTRSRLWNSGGPRGLVVVVVVVVGVVVVVVVVVVVAVVVVVVAVVVAKRRVSEAQGFERVRGLRV